MVRSLYAGISGLRNHQVALDVTGNNISNVNTTGFKAGRVTFEESMAQLLKGATRPPGNAGGTNPMQVGLGMSVGSIDSIMTQGNMQSTGQITDLALEGRGYFVYSSGEGRFFSRNGALQLDATGRLVSPTNGFALQGMTAASDGTYPAGSRIGDIRIPFGEKAPAQETTEVRYQSNLDSDSEGQGTIMHTNRFLAAAESTDRLTWLFDENGNDLGIRAGDVITIGVSDPLGVVPPQSADLVVGSDPGQINSLQQLATAVTSVIGNVVGGAGATVTADGRLEIDMGAASGDVSQLSITTNRPGSNSFVSNLFSFPALLEAGEPPYTSAGAARAPATRNDVLDNLYDAAGNPMGQGQGLEAGDVITINGAVGGSTVNHPPITYDPTMTMDEFMLELQNAFRLPERDGTPQNNLSVDLNLESTGDSRIPFGAVVIRGQPETAFALEDVSVNATDSDNDGIAPNRFIANMVTTDVQEARDTAVHSTSIVVYDESGDAHTMTTTFTHSGDPGVWLWEISMEGGEEILGGNQGRITFGQDGTPSSFTFDDGTTGFRFNPMNGSNDVTISLDVGSPGSLQGITQFRAPTTTAAAGQDGYAMGKLEEISIDEFGEVSGLYSNGVNKSLARIYVAEFNNAAGLLKRGDSMYAVSNNSGEAVLRRPGVGAPTKLKPGALEMSNVELATEFTNMITTQRGYQANARVITTSDSLLQELVQLVR
ncbi:MAG: flagellar hook-basal body complex protein [Chitinivibrionales bacterium]|nr:flagellar hook-basal body complex protein [Chitinivibrionales bacterium]MBD3358680.1 flagellar hook-basal body complex protein [Chitinivibrionales bacterium]